MTQPDAAWSLASHGTDVGAPQELDAVVLGQRRLGDDAWLMELEAPFVAANARPGQFVMMTLAPPGAFIPVLPRPMAIYDVDHEAGRIRIGYRVVGEGTRRLASWNLADRITVVGPLGHAFELNRASSILLIGRGIGLCSLTMLADQASGRGIRTAVVASGRTPDSIFGLDVFRRANASPLVVVNDLDGSSDVVRVRDRIERLVDDSPVEQIFVCGSERLLAAAVDASRGVVEIQVSIEAHMACGLGYCHGCSSGHPGVAREAPLVCRDGPVFIVTADR